jgi:4,5-dihydroxyphthalate decarboxylase
LPPSIRVERIGPEQTLSQMLRDGEIDALYTARAPSSFRAGDDRVVRLFPDYREIERDYYRNTGIFPIMHTIALRRDVYEANRWIAQSLQKAFIQAQARTYADLKESAALKAMLPWLNHHVEEAIAEMGEDYWPYGFERNRATLDTFLRYHHEQGLSKRRLAPEDLFAPESLEAFRI